MGFVRHISPVTPASRASPARVATRIDAHDHVADELALVDGVDNPRAVPPRQLRRRRRRRSADDEGCASVRYPIR
jgi:hypothetical protein